MIDDPLSRALTEEEWISWRGNVPGIEEAIIRRLAGEVERLKGSRRRLAHEVLRENGFEVKGGDLRIITRERDQALQAVESLQSSVVVLERERDEARMELAGIRGKVEEYQEQRDENARLVDEAHARGVRDGWNPAYAEGRADGRREALEEDERLRAALEEIRQDLCDHEHCDCAAAIARSALEEDRDDRPGERGGREGDGVDQDG